MKDSPAESSSEQKPPAAPWEPPTPEEEQAARPLKRTLKKALEEVNSPAKADEVAAEIEQIAEEKKAEDVLEETPPPLSVNDAARKVKTASDTPHHSAQEALTETARQVMAAEGREQEVLAEVVREAAAPEQTPTGAAPEEEAPRNLLREAIIRRMAPYDAVDARLFLAINHLPRNEFANRFFYFLTYIFNGGAAWYAIIALLWLVNPRAGKTIVKSTALPLTLSTMLVEFPIKHYFRRKRPFIKIVQAIVIGKKPGTWSFPSGHSASAFAGAWLLHKHFPKHGPLLYLIAGLVAFSRIFLGDHYPGDVVAGSVAGSIFARLLSRLQKRIKK